MPTRGDRARRGRRGSVAGGSPSSCLAHRPALRARIDGTTRRAVAACWPRQRYRSCRQDPRSAAVTASDQSRWPIEERNSYGNDSHRAVRGYRRSALGPRLPQERAAPALRSDGRIPGSQNGPRLRGPWVARPGTRSALTAVARGRGRAAGRHVLARASRARRQRRAARRARRRAGTSRTIGIGHPETSTAASTSDHGSTNR